MPVNSIIQLYTFTFSDNHRRMIAKVNMYAYLKYGKNWTTNMRDMAKSLFLQFLSSSFLLNPSISKNVRGTGLKFFTQVGAVTCQIVCKQCSLPVNNNKASPVIHYKVEILLHITGYP